MWQIQCIPTPVIWVETGPAVEVIGGEAEGDVIGGEGGDVVGAALIVKKVSDYPNVTVPGTNDFFLLSITNAPGTNHNIKYSALKAAINATNLTLSVNATNANTPNLQDSATVTWSKSGSNLVATAAGGNVTNTYNTIVTTNLTVLNSLTVSNITVTNVTV